MAAERWVLTKEYAQQFDGGPIVYGWNCDLVLYDGNGDKALYRITLDGPQNVNGIAIIEAGDVWVANLTVGNSIDLEATAITLRAACTGPEQDGQQIWGTYERL